jgi:transposase
VIKPGEAIMILELHHQGVSISAIARRLGTDRKTVRKHIVRGLEPPLYGPRPPKPAALDPFLPYLRERVAAWPELSGKRLWRELKERGYQGCYSRVTDALRQLRPPTPASFERRFETPPGQQAQVDFAHFQVTFAGEPGLTRTVWLFSLVLGHSRLIWARFVLHQDLPTVLRCHVAAFAALGGVPREILYDRMKTVVLGEDERRHVVCNRALLDLARHHGFHPRACKPYRAKTKGKVERPFRYIRQDFFLAGTFQDLDDLNAQLQRWLDTVANARVHATTGRVVAEAFAEEQPRLGPLPSLPFRSVLKLERRVSHEGFVSVGGNFYSVPEATRRRALEVHLLADEVRVFEDDRLVATHPVLEGRHRYRVDPGHRLPRPRAGAIPEADELVLGGRPGERVARRSLGFYDAIGRVVAEDGRP